MNKQNILFTIIGLLGGFIIGFFLANSINRNAAFQNPVAQAPSFANAPDNPQTQSVSIKENQGGAMLPEVKETLDKAENSPNDFDAQIQAARLYTRIQNVPKANEFLQKAVAAHQDNFEQLAGLGNGFFDLKNYEEAEKWYSLALAKNPDDVAVRTDLGSTFAQRANPDYDRAIREYQTSLTKNPNREETLFNLALAFHSKGDQAQAQETLAKLEKANPSSSLIEKLKQILATTQQ